MASGVRERIVSAASDRFHVLGYNGCSVQDIVELAGVPKGSFYNYFKAKELLALEILENYGRDSRRDMLADETLPPLKRMRAHFEFLAKRYEGFGFDKGCLI